MNSTIGYRNGVFSCNTSGDASVEGVHDLLDSLLSHNQWKPGSPWLINHLDLNAATLNNDYIQAIVKLFITRHSEIGAGKCAVVVADNLQYGLSRMIIALVGDKWEGDVNLYHSQEKAHDWLIPQ